MAVNKDDAEIVLDSTNPFACRFEDGVFHISVPHPISQWIVRSSLIPLINRMEVRFPVAVHGVPYCLLPDAFELVVDDSGGVKQKICSICSLKDRCSGFSGESGADANCSRPFAPSLREVGIELNRSCLFRCGFCFFKDDPDVSKRIMPKEAVFKLLDELKESGVHAVRFFGGDPVLRPDFIEILKYAGSRSLFTIVNTNGVFKTASDEKNIFAAADLLIISLHGHDEESQGVLTGRPDLFKSVLLSIRRIASAHPDKLMVSTLITEEFERNRDRYLELLYRLGVRRWSLNRQLFSPEDSTHCDYLVKDKESFIALAHWAKRASEEKKIRIILNDLPHCLLKDDERFLVSHNAQTNSMTRLFCDISGFFKPTPSYKMDLGNDLAKAWDASPMRWPGQQSGQPPVPKECLSCKLLMRCLGGSRSMAYLATGRLDGKDPFMIGPIN